MASPEELVEDSAATPEKGLKARLVGEVVYRELKRVTKNPWNANVMTSEQSESLRQGLIEDGWLVSQALLIWGTDEKGVKKDVIIDGEHRWTEAKAVGLKKGPMVFLNKLTEADARKLTIKMNNKRGDWDSAKLSDALKWLEQQGESLSAVDLGFGEEHLMQLLAAPVVELPMIGDPGTGSPPDAGASTEGGGSSDAPAGDGATKKPESQTRMVQLYLDSTTQPQFQEDCKILGAEYGTVNVTDTVLEAIRRAVQDIKNAPAVLSVVGSRQSPDGPGDTPASVGAS